MNKLTKEQIARVFALYMGCHVKFTTNKGHTHIAAIGALASDAVQSADYIDWYLLEQCQLILTPLSSLTDEHAVEVAKWCDNGFRAAKDVAIKRSKETIYLTTGQCDDVSCIRIYRNFFKVERIHEDNECNNITNTTCNRIIDLLRSYNYALPYMGIDLYEAGIAIEPIN